MSVKILSYPSITLLALSIWIVGCNKKSSPPQQEQPGPRGDAPPALSTQSGAKPGACKDGGGQVNDAVSSSFFPGIVGNFCINPDGETKAFGDKASKPIDGICTLFDGGCEMYRNHHIKRTVSIDYVDSTGTAATTNAILSQFATAEDAYSMFTQRVTSDEDPARPDMPQKIDSAPAAALGTGTLYAWKGSYLLELSYVNTDESGDEKRLRASGAQILPPLAKEIVNKLPGSPMPPLSAAKLPAENQIPLGTSYVLQNALGVEGTGAGALGYYREGEKRYRVLVISKADNDQAKDVFKTFAKRKGAQEEKGVGEGATKLMIQEDPEGPKAEWAIGRQGSYVVGVGDESFVLKSGENAAEHEKVSLNIDAKLKKLKNILGSLK